MRLKLLAVTTVLMVASASAEAQLQQRLSIEGAAAVAPALEKYTQSKLLGEVWNRPGLSKRDRSMVTLAALIARNQMAELGSYLDVALESGLKPSEISEIVTHLAFYSGWPNAAAATAIVRNVFAARGIGPDKLPAASPPLLAVNEAAEADRADRVGKQFGSVAPGVVQYTTELLFRDLWLRPDLAPRDRSLVTVSALIASGQLAQLGSHLTRAMDNGLTQQEAAEALTQLAFYAGWPSVFSAMPIAKEVFDKRPK
jgi:4-carboxymuconolactone decarboxylase